MALALSVSTPHSECIVPLSRSRPLPASLLASLCLAALAGCADPPMEAPTEAEAVDIKSGCEAQARGVLDRCGPPSGYYAGLDEDDPAALRDGLHAIIDDHRRITWNSRRGTDTWVVLELADAEPGQPGMLRDVYKHVLFEALGGGYGDYDREHAWPKTYGFADDGRYNYPYNDLHALFIADSGYNSSRNNRPFDWCTDPDDCEDRFIAGGTDRESEANAVDGHSALSGVWTVWAGRRGDIARALFYLDVRYAGGLHRNGGWEPDLILTDDRRLIDGSRSTRNLRVAYMGLRSVLLEWHRQDPPDARERARNDIVARYQGNRNPFIDHPEWAPCVFEGQCGGAVPTGGRPWINELHYDNVGGDTGEFVEIAGPAGFDLSGYEVQAYNGRNGRVYASMTLTNRLGNGRDGVAARAYPFPNLQNGEADGLALIDPDGMVVEFISYEGTLVADDGDAAGMSSVDIGVAETGRTPVGHALSRTSPAPDADWATGPATPGEP